MSFDFNKITQENLTNTTELLTVVPTASTTKNKKTSALLVKINNNIETILYSEYPDPSSTKNNFNGVILMTKLNGDFIRAYRLKNNEFDVELAPTKGNKTNKQFPSKDIIAMENLDEVIVINNYKKPKYKYVPMEFKGPTVSDLEDYYWLKSGGDASIEPTEEDLEEIAKKIVDSIDDSELDECPKDVMSKLKYSGNLDIAFVLQSLGASTDYKVNFVMKPAKSYAETQRTSKYNYEIRVDRTQSTDGTKLFKATVLLHEIIHAHFLSIVDYYNSTPTTLFSLQTSFPDLFEAYVKKSYPNPSDAQHKEMAEKYVEAIAMTLQQYDANDKINYQVYKDLAWGSLSKAPIFSKTFLPGSDEYKRILNRYNAEAVGRAVDQGTPDEQAPVGKPCN